MSALRPLVMTTSWPSTRNFPRYIPTYLPPQPPSLIALNASF